MRAVIRVGANVVPDGADAWQAAVSRYETAIAMQLLSSEATMAHLVDCALAGASTSENLTRLRTIDPARARSVWSAFLDLETMDLVTVARPTSRCRPTPSRHLGRPPPIDVVVTSAGMEHDVEPNRLLGTTPGLYRGLGPAADAR